MTVDDVMRQLMDEHAARADFHLLPEDRIGHLSFAYAVQEKLVEARRVDGWGEIAGWKIGMTTQSMQETTGVSEPCAGAVLSRETHRSGAVLDGSKHVHMGLEGELAVRVSEAFTETAAIDLPTAWQRIDAVAAGLEITDDRNADWGKLEAASLVADNIWNVGMVIGAETSRSKLDGLLNRKGVLTIDGEVYEESMSNDVGCDAMELVAWLGAHLARRGTPLQPGQWVMTGSFVSTTFPKGGSHYHFTVEGLAAVEVRIA